MKRNADLFRVKFPARIHDHLPIGGYDSQNTVDWVFHITKSM